MIPTALKFRLKSSPIARELWSLGHGLVRSLDYWRTDPQQILDAFAADIPRTLKIELTNVCNADCTFCGYQYETRTKGTMSRELYRDVLEQYRAMGGTDISFTPVVGEPLLDRDFVGRVRLAHEMGYRRIFTYTNGILLEKHDLHALLTSGIERIQLSTAGFDQEEFRRVFRSKQYPRLLRGLRKLLELNQQLGHPVRIRIELRSDSPLSEVVRRKDYRENVQPYIDEAKDLGCLVEYDTWGGMVRQEHLTGTMRLARNPRFKRSPCFRTYSAMILWDGQVRACSCRFSYADPVDGLLVGNLRRQSLQDIWFGDTVRRLRQSFLDNTIPGVCRTCTMYIPGSLRGNVEL